MKPDYHTYFRKMEKKKKKAAAEELAFNLQL